MTIRIVAAGVVAFSLWASVAYSTWMAASPKPPPIHELKSTTVSPPVVSPGDDDMVRIVVTTTSIRRAECSAHIHRTVANAETGVVVYHAVGIGNQAPPSGKLAEFPYHIALARSAIPPGRYFYSALAINRCEHDAVVVAPSESAFFDVVER